MMTSMLTVENIVAGKRIYNIWNVNEDAEYHESGDEGEQDAIAAEPSDAKTISKGGAEAPSITIGQAAALKSERDVPKRINKGSENTKAA